MLVYPVMETYRFELVSLVMLAVVKGFVFNMEDKLVTNVNVQVVVVVNVTVYKPSTGSTEYEA
jgi:hypothetical protein